MAEVNAPGIVSLDLEQLAALLWWFHECGNPTMDRWDIVYRFRHVPDWMREHWIRTARKHLADNHPEKDGWRCPKCKTPGTVESPAIHVCKDQPSALRGG